jgi:catechol 2,3-dioxygenase-like lactoylglutathione lyase family enzyme
MLGYATIGTKDLKTACAFYDALLAGIGGKQLMGLDPNGAKLSLFCIVIH